MNFKAADIPLKKLAGFADWKLLAFLVLFMDVKLVVKVVAIVLMYLTQFDLRFGFRFKNSRLPLFYLLVIGIAVLNGLLYKSYFNLRYDLVFVTGIGFWLLCILALHQVKLSVEKNTAEVLHNTILAFFVLNAAVTAFNLFSIIAEIHTINPYLYQGQNQKYFIGTGDYIKGITFDVSITNAVLNALGVIYFLIRKNALMQLICMAALLLSGSNAVNLMLTGILVLLFLFKSTKDQKCLIAICVMFLAVFMINVSPQNSNYAANAFNKLFHKDKRVILVSTHTTPILQAAINLSKTEEEQKKIATHYLDSISLLRRSKAMPASGKVIEPDLPRPNLDSKPYWEAPDTTPMRRILLQFIAVNRSELPISAVGHKPGMLPGKVIALQQVTDFLLQHPFKMLTGDGLGNFSSKVAFKATDLGFNGNYLAKYVYISKDFLTHHLDIYLHFFSEQPELHSILNDPNSVYFQLLGEYGLMGLLAFCVFYLWYFLRHYHKLSYGIPILLFVLGIFFLEYWFEQLSIMVFVELLLLVNIKDAGHKTITT